MMTYLLFGYSVTWALIAAYLLVLGNRQQKLQKEIQQLEEWREE